MTWLTSILFFTLAALTPMSAAILPSEQIDSVKAVSHFLPYQVEWINDDSRLRLAEKSVRIGWTWCDAFKNVRKRLLHADRDYLFCTKDLGSAVEYMRYCLRFCELYDRTRSILTHGEETMKVPVMKDGKDTGFTEEVKFCTIKFDNKSRIIAFSSNPNAMLVYGGDVGIDEYAAHQRADELWETAQGRITMGYDLGCWSAHKGMDTQFNTFAREAKQGLRGWSYYRVTMADAVDQGYLQMLERRTGKLWTKEDFLADCRNRAGSDEAYEQAYMCNPRGGTFGAVPWSSIELCGKVYPYERAHLEASQVLQRFGKYVEGRGAERAVKIEAWAAEMFAAAILKPARHTMGFDVAASGKGDLASIWIDEVQATGAQQMKALFTCRTDDWHFIECMARFFMRRMTSITGAGDATGLGKQICWNLARAFEGRFHETNFATEKHDMGHALVAAMQTGEKIFPVDKPGQDGLLKSDIAADHSALQKEFSGNLWRFIASKNPLNAASHCDIVWSSALSLRARSLANGEFSASSLSDIIADSSRSITKGEVFDGWSADEMPLGAAPAHSHLFA